MIINFKEKTANILPKNIGFGLGSNFVLDLAVLVNDFTRVSSALGDGFAFFLD